MKTCLICPVMVLIIMRTQLNLKMSFKYNKKINLILIISSKVIINCCLRKRLFNEIKTLIH